MGITESIKIIANILGVDEDKFNTITNTVYLNDKMNIDDCSQLFNLGFPIYDEIAKLKDCSKAEAKELVISGKITSADYNNILLSNYFIQKHNEIFELKEKS
ncbi:hypothetical protein ACQ7CX_04135 [Chryseobacterium arthrosphaerae]|uniref:hypothetical protein n=1 Tax=Chryseobacterium arthrosphaerae TaxID=651561 RepID=UPI001BAE614B|nr:hypothetical protein [Chryseobacterium arthrosphaerae]QUY57311.1 hypothetical protein I2F65_08270 [Chryseobacterium arthrosphaerae]